MEIYTEKNGDDLIIKLSGELNTLTAPDLNKVLDKELTGVTNLTMDFEECGYVSSAGIRVLLSTYKQLKATNGHMKLIHVDEDFMEVLENTCLDGVFDIE